MPTQGKPRKCQPTSRREQKHGAALCKPAKSHECAQCRYAYRRDQQVELQIARHELADQKSSFTRQRNCGDPCSETQKVRWSPFDKWTDKRPNVNNCAENPANLLQNTSVSLVRHESVKKQQLAIAPPAALASAPPLSGLFMTESRMYLRGIRSPNHRQRSRCPTAGPVREDL